jgi:hypothetical protein
MNEALIKAKKIVDYRKILILLIIVLILVFSNASAFRYESNIPIMIPEINGDHYFFTSYRTSRYL